MSLIFYTGIAGLDSENERRGTDRNKFSNYVCLTLMGPEFVGEKSIAQKYGIICLPAS